MFYAQSESRRRGRRKERRKGNWFNTTVVCLLACSFHCNYIHIVSRKGQGRAPRVHKGGAFSLYMIIIQLMDHAAIFKRSALIMERRYPGRPAASVNIHEYIYWTVLPFYYYTLRNNVSSGGILKSPCPCVLVLSKR